MMNYYDNNYVGGIVRGGFYVYYVPVKQRSKYSRTVFKCGNKGIVLKLTTRQVNADDGYKI